MDIFDRIEMEIWERPVVGLLLPEKLVDIVRYADLDAGSRVIDFGCGYGEALRCWAACFGVSGVGIDADARHIEGAKAALAGWPHGARLEYVCGDAVRYAFEPGSFDMAACLSATNMFGEEPAMFGNAIRHMKRAIRTGGHLLIAQPYYNEPDVPAELIDYEGRLTSEEDLLRTLVEEGFELVYMVHSEVADWDRYISSNLFHAVRWLRENRDHPDWRERLEKHRRFHDMYVRYRRRYQEFVALLMTAL